MTEDMVYVLNREHGLHLWLFGTYHSADSTINNAQQQACKVEAVAVVIDALQPDVFTDQLA